MTTAAASGSRYQESKIKNLDYYFHSGSLWADNTCNFCFYSKIINMHTLVRCVFSNKTKRKYSMIVVRQTQPTVCITVSNFKIMHHATVQSHFTDYFSPFIQKHFICIDRNELTVSICAHWALLTLVTFAIQWIPPHSHTMIQLHFLSTNVNGLQSGLHSNDYD